MTRAGFVLPVVIGIALGIVVSLAQSPAYRATTTVAVKVNGAPAAVPTVAALAKSDAVVENVARPMHVSPSSIRDHLHVSVVPGTALVRLRYDDASRVRAEQLAQQEASVLQAIVTSRFGGSTTIAVVDPARAERLGRPVLADALWGALLGVLAGVGLQFTPRRPRPPAVPVAEDEEPPAAEVPAAVPVPEPAPAPAPAAVVLPPKGRTAELREAFEARRGEFGADQEAEWEAYLMAFEAQEVDGRLPANLEGLARDVFAPLLDRA